MLNGYDSSGLKKTHCWVEVILGVIWVSWILSRRYRVGGFNLPPSRLDFHRHPCYLPKILVTGLALIGEGHFRSSFDRLATGMLLTARSQLAIAPSGVFLYPYGRFTSAIAPGFRPDVEAKLLSHCLYLTVCTL